MARRQEALFIGYRREDTGGDAGRIYDRLAQAFGRERVFKDVDSIPRGVRFREYVEGIIDRCRIFLVLIGPKWIDSTDENGNRRLENPEDLVRVEIETALATPNVQVLPVLVAGAPMPRRDQLPGRLSALAEFNAAELRRDPDFHGDMDRLIRAIEMGATVRRRNPLIPIAASAVVALAAVGGGGYWYLQSLQSDAATVDTTTGAPADGAAIGPATTQVPQTQPAQTQQASVSAPPPQEVVKERPQPRVTASIGGSWSGVYRCVSSVRPEGQTRYTFEESGGRITGASETFSRGILSGAATYDVISQSGDGRRFTLSTTQFGGYEIDFTLSSDGSTLNGVYRNHTTCETVSLRRR